MGIGPYGSACRGGRPCPPSPGNATLCRAGPVCPAGGAGKESPSHGFAVPAPFRQGGLGDGGCGLPQPVTSVTGFAMTGSFTWGAEAIGGEVRAPRPTTGYHGVRRGGALPPPRATARVAPTEGYKECGGPGDRKGRPYPPSFRFTLFSLPAF